MSNKWTKTTKCDAGKKYGCNACPEKGLCPAARVCHAIYEKGKHGTDYFKGYYWTAK